MYAHISHNISYHSCLVMDFRICYIAKKWQDDTSYNCPPQATHFSSPPSPNLRSQHYVHFTPAPSSSPPLFKWCVDRKRPSPGHWRAYHDPLPFDMHGPPITLPHMALSSTTRQVYHPCVVHPRLQTVHSLHVVVYVCRSYVHAPDPVSLVRSLPPNEFDYLLPVPLNPRPATPAEFGDPLSFDGTYFLP